MLCHGSPKPGPPCVLKSFRGPHPLSETFISGATGPRCFIHSPHTHSFPLQPLSETLRHGVCTDPTVLPSVSCPSYALCSKSPATDKSSWSHGQPTAYPGPRLEIRDTLYSAQMLASEATWVASAFNIKLIFVGAEGSAVLPIFRQSHCPTWEQEVQQQPLWMWGERRARVHSLGKHSFCEHFMCSEKNGSSGQASTKLFYESGP